MKLSATRFSTFAAVLIVLTAVPARALTVHTTLRGAAEPQTVILRARSVANTAPPVAAEIHVPSDASLELRDGLWELSIDSTIAWANRKVVPSDGEVTLDLSPAATISGTLPRTSPPISRVTVAFIEGDSLCTVDGTAWRCVVPAGMRDLRFGAPGYAAIYRWDVQLRAGAEVGIGVLPFVRGASLTGHVSTRETMSEVRVTAVPRTRTGKGSGYAATPNARGFFQIAGIEAGDYVVAAKGRRTRSEGTVVRVIENRTAELRAPLVLETPKRIVVAIAPPLAPDGSRWRVELLRHDVDANHLDSIVAGPAARDGTWSHEAVAGEYVVNVGEGGESVWSAQNVHVATADVTLSIDVHPLRVMGTVTLGNHPIAARLTFGKRKTAVADAEGRFSAVVPLREDDEWDVDVENESPPVRRTLEHQKPTRDDDGNLRLDIRLPATSIAGRVVNSDGTAEAHAIVTLDSSEGREVQQVFTGDDGAFELFGFPSGAYRMRAEGYLKASDLVPIAVADEQSASVELVLRPEVRVKGRVIADASPVIGARIAAMPRDSRAILIPTATSNEAGLFSLGLPPNTTTFDVIVTGFGFAATMGRAYAGERKMVTVGVDRRGGRLVLHVPAKALARVLHGGGEAAVLWLAREAGGAIESRDGFDVVTLPELEQGDYQLCIEARCASGTLAAGGKLTLSVGEETPGR